MPLKGGAWNSDKNYGFTDKQRTHDLADRMIPYIVQLVKFHGITDRYKSLPTEFTKDKLSKILESFNYLKSIDHFRMIEYQFNNEDGGKLVKLKIGPSSWTFLPGSVQTNCNHSKLLYDFLKYFTSGNKNIDVELSTRCPSADPAAGPNVGTNVETVETNGGYKSRRRNRKPARKTRRRGRGRDRRGKSHHKKYTH